MYSLVAHRSFSTNRSRKIRRNPEMSLRSPDGLIVLGRNVVFRPPLDAGARVSATVAKLPAFQGLTLSHTKKPELGYPRSVHRRNGCDRILLPKSRRGRGTQQRDVAQRNPVGLLSQGWRLRPHCSAPSRSLAFHTLCCTFVVVFVIVNPT